MSLCSNLVVLTADCTSPRQTTADMVNLFDRQCLLSKLLPSLCRMQQNMSIISPVIFRIYLHSTLPGAGMACWLERRTSDRKVASSNPGRSGGRIFFSRVNFVFWLLFGVRSTPVLRQWHVKYPGHSAKSAGGRLHLNMHTPLTQRSRSGLTMPLSRHSVGTYQETISPASHRGTPGHSRLSSLSHCGLILV